MMKFKLCNCVRICFFFPFSFPFPCFAFTLLHVARLVLCHKHIIEVRRTFCSPSCLHTCLFRISSSMRSQLVLLNHSFITFEISSPAVPSLSFNSLGYCTEQPKQRVTSVFLLLLHFWQTGLKGVLAPPNDSNRALT